MIKFKEPNPYNLFEIRRLKVPSPHCDYINIPLRYNLERSIKKWIVDNLKGRYYIGTSVTYRPEGGTETVCKIGFEEPKELSYFTLACPLLKYK
jgi:hypothetical protein